MEEIIHLIYSITLKNYNFILSLRIFKLKNHALLIAVLFSSIINF